MRQESVIVFMSDFGERDAYVGIVKGVIAKIAPKTRVIDLTHEIPFGDLRQAAFLLWQAEPYFPEDAIFLTVVDPGVGTSRRGVIVESKGKRYIGPDNGLFTYLVLDGYQAWQLSETKYMLDTVSYTFHGRDIFAPIAAHASLGMPSSAFGPQLNRLEMLSFPYFVGGENSLSGEVLYIDRFGNLITSLGRFIYLDADTISLSPWLPAVKPMVINVVESGIKIEGRGERHILPLKRTFMDVPVGSPAAVIGSSGLIEIVVNSQNAANMLGLRVGDRITLQKYNWKERSSEKKG